jgi:hypothetical protein
LKPNFVFSAARQWTSGDSIPVDVEKAIPVPPGETVFVEFVLD